VHVDDALDLVMSWRGRPVTVTDSTGDETTAHFTSEPNCLWPTIPKVAFTSGHIVTIPREAVRGAVVDDDGNPHRASRCVLTLGDGRLVTFEVAS
jgi:hypothetical protein